MIPRIIHYVWVGPKRLPEKDAGFVAEWRRLMPGWEFRFWSDQTIDFASSTWLQAAYAMKGWNRIADYMRVWAVMTHGGIYLDTDVELLKPLDPLLRHSAFISYQTDARFKDKPGADEWVNSAVFGAEPGHWFPTEVYQALMSSAGGWKDQGAWTGPGVATEVLRRHGLMPPQDAPATVRDVTVLPRRAFHPYHWSQDPSEAEITEDTFGIHHWAGSWTEEAKHWPLSKKLMLRCVRIAPHLAYRLRRRQLDARRVA